LLLSMIFTIFNCVEKTAKSEIEPPPVIFIQGLPDTSHIERGIDAVPEENAIHLEWNRSSDENVTHYEIYRGEQREGLYYLIANITDPDTSYLDRNISVSQRYFYYIYAVNDYGIKSPPSDTLDYQLLEKAILKRPISGDTTGTQPIFQWEDPNNEAWYILRLQEVNSDQYILITLVQSTYSPVEELTYNDALLPRVSYQWRIDVASSISNCGSESQWSVFTVR
jgi:fibronectin type 3 domain-containing protein